MLGLVKVIVNDEEEGKNEKKMFFLGENLANFGSFSSRFSILLQSHSSGLLTATTIENSRKQ